MCQPTKISVGHTDGSVDEEVVVLESTLIRCGTIGALISGRGRVRGSYLPGMRPGGLETGLPTRSKRLSTNILPYEVGNESGMEGVSLDEGRIDSLV